MLKLFIILNLFFICAQSSAQITFGPEFVTVPVPQTAHFTKTIDLTSKPKGWYLLKVHNGISAPEKLDFCKSQDPLALVNQCLYENLIYKISDDPKMFQSFFLDRVNGIANTRGSIGSLVSYSEGAINLAQDINTLEFTATGYPTSLLNYTLEPIALADIKSSAIITIASLGTSTAYAFNVRGNQSRDPLGRTLTYSCISSF